jgi:hypothetical protein
MELAVATREDSGFFEVQQCRDETVARIEDQCVERALRA